MRARRSGEAAGIDPAENDIEVLSENIRNRGRRGRRPVYTGSGSRASSLASNASRMRSVSALNGSAVAG